MASDVKQTEMEERGDASVPETSRLSAEFAFLTRLHELLTHFLLLHVLVRRDREASRCKEESNCQLIEEGGDVQGGMEDVPCVLEDLFHIDCELLALVQQRLLTRGR